MLEALCARKGIEFPYRCLGHFENDFAQQGYSLVADMSDSEGFFKAQFKPFTRVIVRGTKVMESAGKMLGLPCQQNLYGGQRQLEAVARSYGGRSPSELSHCLALAISTAWEKDGRVWVPAMSLRTWEMELLRQDEEFGTVCRVLIIGQ